MDDYVANPSDASKLAMPERRTYSYFNSIEREILANVEKGSPDSLRSAISQLKRNKDEMSENEKVLHYIAVSIMQMCWKSQNFVETTNAQDIKNDYTGAVSSSKNGFYDPSQNPQDFLGYAVPALVLAASDTRSDYYEEAEKSLLAALKLNPNSVFANYLTGILYRRMSDLKKANEYFGRAYDLSPNCYECALAFAESFMKLSDPDSAFALSEKLLQSYPQNKELLKICAEASFASGNTSSAELYVGRVLQMEPENSYYLLFRARILVQKGEYIRAASLLDAYSRRDSSSRDYLLLRFAVQKNWNKNISAATSTIENALSLYPDDFQVVIEAANLAAETGAKINGKSGEELANLILEREPENITALQIKIASMVALQKWAEAYRVSSQLVSREEVSDSVLYMHIKICLSAGKKDEAWQLASRLYAENSSSEEILQIYIDVLVSTSRMSEASRLISQLLPAASAKMKSFLYYERSFISDGESAVLADLRSSLTANPRNKDSLFRLYRIYYNKKEYRKAQYYLKQVVAISPKDDSLLRLNSELENLLKN
ncbi:tetratricopeptide repeat protein [uncultured Treponema sp.]|uniref:tetratricopeptide repeat protein n=1 Tax=uncultured Treponema sp. TaxID=162155 RepID=UPI0025EE1DE3|nr:tetratricopeptide repeat protein [uncultured Treponema sp.]